MQPCHHLQSPAQHKAKAASVTGSYSYFLSLPMQPSPIVCVTHSKCCQCHRLLLMDPVYSNAALSSFPVACTTHSKRCQCHRLLLMDPVSPNTALPSFPMARTTHANAISVTGSCCVHSTRRGCIGKDRMELSPLLLDHTVACVKGSAFLLTIQCPLDSRQQY